MTKMCEIDVRARLEVHTTPEPAILLDRHVHGGMTLHGAGEASARLRPSAIEQLLAQGQPEEHRQEHDHDGAADELSHRELPSNQQRQDHTQFDDQIGGCDLEDHSGGKAGSCPKQCARQCHGRIGTRRRCRPEAGGDNQRARPIVTQPLLDRGSPHDGLHDSRQCEPQDQRPQNLPCHGTADGQSMADGVQPPHAASQRRMAMGTGYRSIGAGGRPSPLGPDKSKLSIRIRATPLAGFGRVHGQASATRSSRRRFWLA